MVNPVRFVFASLAAILTLAPMSDSLHAQQAAPTSTRLAASVDSIVQAELLARGVASVQVVITRGDETLLSRTWGFADIDAQRRADHSTTYRLGSMGKQFNAALLLKLVDRGALSLDDPIGRYLDGLKPEWNDRTIAQILNHTSGLPREFREISRVSDNLPTDSLIALARRTADPAAPAGAEFIYSNTGYMLLGALVEKLYGKSYSAVLRDEIAQPLGLETIAWCGDLEAEGSHAKAEGSHAKGYHGQPDSTAATPPFYLHPSQLLAGGVCSNAADIARWNRALHDGKVLSEASYEAMTTPTGVAAERSVPYGFGLYVRATTGGETVIVSDGRDAGGYSNENVWYPDESLSVTMLTNTVVPALGTSANLTEVMGRIALGRP